MNLLQQIGWSIVMSLRDVLPICIVVVFFQSLVLRRPILHWQRILAGIVCVVIGLAVFLVGLELALFPLGEAMAQQLATPEFVAQGLDLNKNEAIPWHRFYWTYLFAFAIGFSATIAEPALQAVAIKAHEVSGGTIHVWGLRSAVAFGSGIGVALGTFRIVTGIPLPYFILTGYCVVIVQTYFAPKKIIPLAYDSGGVTTSTITVPLVTALGLGLAGHIPGRNPLAEGFGMIALAVLFPMITVMGYGQVSQWLTTRATNNEEHSRG